MRYLFLLLPLVLCAAEAPLLTNGGFDETKDGATVGWKPVGAKYVYRDGEGRSGTRALCFANDDPGFYSFPGQSVALKAGKVYEYEVWVRTEDLKGPETGASVCIEWCDAQGKWLGGSYADGVKGTRDWTCVKGVTEPIPKAAASFRVHPYVRKGVTGKAWFDDVAVRERAPKPVSGLCSSAYRNLAVDGDVTFVAASDIPPDASAGTEVVLLYRDAGGAVRRARAVRGDGDARVTLPVSSLAMGRQEVRAEARAGDRVLGSATCGFTRAARLPDRAVWIDRHGRTVVGGEPFFPLGMYWSGVTSNKVETYAQGPFNCLMPYNAPNARDLLDLCQEKGLKVIYSVKDVFSGTRWAPKGIDTEADEVRYIADRVARFKDHPAVLAWYLNDEMPLSMLDRLTARRDLLERLDPGHPGWVVLYQYTQIRDYLPTFDVIGTDPYPIPRKPAATAALWTRLTRKGTLGCKPLWQVPQAFNWAAYKKSPEERAKNRAPTEAELRAMCWQCVAEGANGLVLYSFFDLEKEPNGEPFAKRWAECCRVGAEIRAQIPVLLSAEGAARTLVADCAYERPDADWRGPADPVSVRAWAKDGDTYVLVVNGLDAARTVRVALGADAARASAAAVFGPAPKLDGDAFSLALGPLEPAMVRLKR